jgi:serine/threonine protein kinase
MSEAGSTSRRVWISYSSDSTAHTEAVLDLAQRLRGRGIDAWIDRFEPAPPQGWPRWIADQVESAKYVLLVCTPNYKRRFEGREAGRGTTYEGLLASQLLYDGKFDLSRLVPVLLSDATEDDIPLVVRAATHHVLERGFEGLVERLHDRASVVPAPLGKRVESSKGMPDQLGLADRLAALYMELEQRELADEDTTELRTEILAVRRRLREGRSLQAFDILDARYRLIRPSGRGGFGVVWEAWDYQERRRVAVKVLHHQWVEDRERIGRFARGARKMGELRHPGIVPVLRDHVKDEQHHFYVMEWMPGGDLAWLIRERRISPEDALRALASIGDALDHAHRADLVHRDVKPQNILFDASGNAALTDFDLVHAFDTTQGTRTAGMGTFVYAAPELLEDASRVDRRVDVYGLGMTVLYCVLGRDPPAMVARTAPDALQRLPCSEALAREIQCAVAYDKESRAVDCGGLARALSGIGQDTISNEATSTRFDLETSQSTAIFDDPQRTYFLAVAGVCVLILVGLLYAATQSVQGEARDESPVSDSVVEPAAAPTAAEVATNRASPLARGAILQPGESIGLDFSPSNTPPLRTRFVVQLASFLGEDIDGARALLNQARAAGLEAALIQKLPHVCVVLEGGATREEAAVVAGNAKHLIPDEPQIHELESWCDQPLAVGEVHACRNWVLWARTFPDHQAAISSADRLENAGIPARVFLHDSQFKVLAGMYENVAAARSDEARVLEIVGGESAAVWRPRVACPERRSAEGYEICE